jgi:hypothetical protein
MHGRDSCAFSETRCRKDEKQRNTYGKNGVIEYTAFEMHAIYALTEVRNVISYHDARKYEYSIQDNSSL